MGKNKRQIIKRYHKTLIFGIIIGMIIASGGVYAITSIAGSNITYSNTNSGLSSTNVQGAIDELYNKTKSLGIKYAVGDPNKSGVTTYTNYMELVNSGHKVFIASINNENSLCIYRNGSLSCYMPNKEAMSHIKQVFGANYCDDKTSEIICTDTNFECDFTNSSVDCTDRSTRKYCSITDYMNGPSIRCG